jgi:hypothetical protein
VGDLPRRAALKLSLACLLAGGFVLIVCVLTGSFGELAWRVALALAAIWLFGLTGIHGIESANADVRFARLTGIVAQITALVGLVISLVAIGIWSDSRHFGESFWRFFLALTVVAITSGHGGYLLSRTRPDDTSWTRRAVYCAYTAFAAIAVGSCLVAAFARSNLDEGTKQFLWRLLAVAVIVGVGGSIAAPILRRLSAQPAETA